jgi:histidinol-phosphatase
MIEPALKGILDFALELSREVGRFILPLWKHVTVKHKPDGSEVTEADRGAELLLRQRIVERYPDHAVFGEEFGGDLIRDTDHLWLIDPVDGTASFAIGLPLFGTLIAYLSRGEPCVGVIAAHALAETTYAAIGHGCWHQFNGGSPKQVHTSTVTDLADALVASTSIENTDLDPRHPNSSVCLSRLYRQARRFRWSGDCINYVLLCQGRVDVAIDPRMSPWDIAAVAPCVREAGGVLSSLDGNLDIIWSPSLVASANPSLHAKVLESLRLA